MKENSNDINSVGIRSDRIMTTQEVMNAAINYRSVKNAADIDLTFKGQPNLFGKILVALYWGLIGFCILVVLIIVIMSFF